MGWARFDDNYSFHPKIVEAGPYAELLDVRAIIYCAGHDTDGAISRSALRLITRDIPKSRDKVARLVELGRWDVTEDGYAVHDFLRYNPSKSERRGYQELKQKRKQVFQIPGLIDAIKDRDQGLCRYCMVRVSWKDRRGPTGGTYDHVMPLSKGGETNLENVVTACRSCNSAKGDHEDMLPMPPPSSYELGPELEKPNPYKGSGLDISISKPKEHRVRSIERCRTCGQLDVDCQCEAVTA